MAKIGVKIVEPTPDFEEGKAYHIKDVQRVRTDKRDYDAYRVEGIEVETGDEAATMLWVSDEVSTDSKLGAFLTVLGDETDAWKDKIVECVRWRDKERIITVRKEVKQKKVQ